MGSSGIHGRVHGDLCQFRLIDIHSITMTAPKLVLAGALVAIFLLSLDTVQSQCLNCEAPYGPYCCKGSFNSVCCEYPIERMDKSSPQLSPLERQLKAKENKKKTQEKFPTNLDEKFPTNLEKKFPTNLEKKSHKFGKKISNKFGKEISNKFGRKVSNTLEEKFPTNFRQKKNDAPPPSQG